MKNIILLIIASLIVFFIFKKPSLKINFQVTNVGCDTTFQNSIWSDPDGYPKHISVRAVGEIDNLVEIFITNSKHNVKFLPVQLPAGKFDTTWIGEYYEERADIIYLHRKAKKGEIKLTFRYLTPDGDTLK